MVAMSGADRERIDSGGEPAEHETQRVEPHPTLAMQGLAGNTAVARAVDRLLQRSAGSGGEAQQARDAGADTVIRRTLAGGGLPLEGLLRSSMERQLGHDLSRVRLHTGADADASARAVNARAYTVGQDVVFADGAFEPSLLAHELVHTLQQPKGRVDGEAVRVEPPGTSLEQAAERGGGGPPGSTGRTALQRQPAPGGQAEPESLFTIFVAEDAKKTDVRFARDQGRKDAARIRKAGTFSTEERQLVRAKLRFFEGDAWTAYSDTIRPALVEATQEEIEMEGDPPADAGGPTKQLDVPTSRLKFLQEQPTYIDNEIKEVNYFTAELAIIHYRDGTKYELGLVPRWMKPPVVEVDYLTPAEEIRPYGAPSGGFGYINEPELAQAPRTMPYAELMKTYVHDVDFYIEKGTARVVPSRINMLTAPNLCRILRDSLRRWQEEYVEPAVYLGVKGTAIVGMYAGQGGLPVNTGVAATKMFVSRAAPRVALSQSGKRLAGEMDKLLASGGAKTLEAEGVQFAGVEVTRQGSTLAVKRFMSKAVNPGQGAGFRMAKEFEDAAAEVGRMSGAKTVTVDVGIIINPGWRQVLEARGYVHIIEEGRWVKTIKLE